MNDVYSGGRCRSSRTFAREPLKGFTVLRTRTKTAEQIINGNNNNRHDTYVYYILLDACTNVRNRMHPRPGHGRNGIIIIAVVTTSAAAATAAGSL